MPQRSINASAPGAPPLPIPPSPGGALRPAVPPGGEAAGHPAQTGASAQGAPAGAQGGSPGQGNRMLDVLGLDPKQKAQAEAVFAKHPPSDPDDPDSVREARRAAMAELMPLLRPDQRAKFDAWRAQMRARMGGGG